MRYRLGGRAYPVSHGGSFPTMKEARARRDLIAGELAAGRNPADLLRAMVERPKMRTFREWTDAYKASRVDLAEQTTANMESHIKRCFRPSGNATLRRSPLATSRNGSQRRPT